MSTTSWTPASSLSSETPQHALVGFLAKESPRYVAIPMGTCDAIFVNHWFEDRILPSERKSPNTHTTRLFEMMHSDFNYAAVLGIKHLMLNQHDHHQERLRLRWLPQDEACAEVFLISCYGITDHVAVIPTPYLRRRFGKTRTIEGVFEPHQAWQVLPFLKTKCPSWTVSLLLCFPCVLSEI
jgi:hypothetical protein